MTTTFFFRAEYRIEVGLWLLRADESVWRASLLLKFRQGDVARCSWMPATCRRLQRPKWPERLQAGRCRAANCARSNLRFRKQGQPHRLSPRWSFLFLRV